MLQKAMIKSELILAIANEMKQLPEKDIDTGVNKILQYMTQALSNGTRIEVRGFGSFSLHYRAPRNAHNPKTGEKVVTVTKHIPHFKPGKDFRERINNAFLKEKAVQSSDSSTGSDNNWA